MKIQQVINVNGKWYSFDTVGVNENKIVGNKKIIIATYETNEQATIELNRYAKKYNVHRIYKFPSIKQHKNYERLSAKMRSD